MELRELGTRIIRNRTIRRGFLGSILVLTACSGGHVSSKAETTTTETSVLSSSSSTTTESGLIPPLTVTRCQAKEPSSWQPTPANMNAESIAKALDVLPDDIRAGRWGPVICKEGITVEAIQTGTAQVTADEIGGPCLAIGIGGNQPPDPTKTYTDILAVCVVEPKPLTA